MLSYAAFVLVSAQKKEGLRYDIKLDPLFCYFFPNLKVKCIYYAKFIECSKEQVKKLDFIFESEEHFKIWKIFIICEAIKQAMIIFTLTLTILLSSPARCQTLEENRSAESGTETQTPGSLDDFYQDNFRFY